MLYNVVESDNDVKILLNIRCRRCKRHNDASWYSLTQKINVVAAKSGVLVVKVAPQFTSQKCSHCGHVDKNSRNGEKFICTNCGHFDHADLQAARNIRSKGIDQLKLPVACRYPAKYVKTVRVDCSEPKQRPIV